MDWTWYALLQGLILWLLTNNILQMVANAGICIPRPFLESAPSLLLLFANTTILSNVWQLRRRTGIKRLTLTGKGFTSAISMRESRWSNKAKEGESLVLAPLQENKVCVASPLWNDQQNDILDRFSPNVDLQRDQVRRSLSHPERR